MYLSSTNRPNWNAIYTSTVSALSAIYIKDGYEITEELMKSIITKARLVANMEEDTA
jgi:hypothetical protein